MVCKLSSNKSTLHPNPEKKKKETGIPYKDVCDVCGKCGAKRVDSQMGLEQSPEEYVSKMVGIFREVKRVLRKDGTLWLNLGDSYVGGGKGNYGSGLSTHHGTVSKHAQGSDFPKPKGLKDKDLVGIPWAVAFALRADGWYLRQDIIWSKKNCMPEAVTDRCTKSHEYIFLLSKSKHYHYDYEAIKEPLSNEDRVNFQSGARTNGINEDRNDNDLSERSKTIVYTSRNKRSVWTVATTPYPGSHFATFPIELITPCVLAGCPVGGTVLDPFGGSGTTGYVADMYGRNAILIELNPEYVKLIESRIKNVPPPNVQEKKKLVDTFSLFD